VAGRYETYVARAAVNTDAEAEATNPITENIKIAITTWPALPGHPTVMKPTNAIKEMRAKTTVRAIAIP
jgi:hypothetical protein